MIYCDKEFIGKKLKEYRKKAKLTQEELSERIEIAEKHYGKLERGVFNPSLETFFKLVEILNIPLDEFGLNNKIADNELRDNIIKEIYSSTNEEIELYLKLIQDVKHYNFKIKK